MTDFLAVHFFAPSPASRGGLGRSAFDLPARMGNPLPTFPCARGEEQSGGGMKP